MSPDTVRVSPELAAAMREARELRALIAEILSSVEATTNRAGMRANIATWRKRAGLEA